MVTSNEFKQELLMLGGSNRSSKRAEKLFMILKIPRAKMTTTPDETKVSIDEETEDEQEEEEYEYDPSDAAEAEERQKTCWDRYSGWVFIGVLILLALLYIGVICFCFYMSRFAFRRGVTTVKLTFNSVTWSNVGNALTGNEIVWATSPPPITG